MGSGKAIETEYGVTDVSVISRKRTADLRNKWILPNPFVSRSVVEVGWNRVSRTSRPKGEGCLEVSESLFREVIEMTEDDTGTVMLHDFTNRSIT